ncbi:RluA family pseudouridine synthase [Boudabousia marimammalium]|uniref:Pseudouridine synthase n=1 Tax=Boudabousia marimammalium TaxID=156892 RepID=A0A1Q5PPA8_9ACTO|nr:RluA family pseudouridine synthase [Boudabousia marimammalium]OKL49235.1 hypothetical protein BM477_04390 [Boudabousia marimammalium]
MTERPFKFVATEAESGIRLDILLADSLQIPRSRVHKAILAGEVLVNGAGVRKSYSLRAGDEIEAKVTELEELSAAPTPYPLPVHYVDEHILVIDKPMGMAAHPAHGWDGPTVLGALIADGYDIQTSGDSYRQGIVHRLDAATTGLMVVARTEVAFQALKTAFQHREVKKTYHALVQGHMPHMNGTIDAPIGRSSTKDFRMAIRNDGKPAITHYQVVEKHLETDLLQIELETGRTHQIRVHCAALHRPCIGDSQYGANPRLSQALAARRQWLHASNLAFVHPVTGEPLEFSSTYPEDLQIVLEKARQYGESTRALKQK